MNDLFDSHNWSDRGDRWVWAGSDGDPAFTVIKKRAPFGPYYRIQMLLPNGEVYAAANQKATPEPLFQRAAELYGQWDSLLFDLSNQPERWGKL